MTKVYFTNLTKDKLDKTVLTDMKRCIQKTVTTLYPKTSFEVSLTLCDNAYIKELNAEYRGIDRETDVLSFPICDFDIPKGPKTLGDIVISIEKATSQAEEYGHSLKRELCFLCVHSTLHLLGINHEDDEESRKKMEDMQEEILNSLGIVRE
ncbi:MAG: rRNA maturation RNase YbeY [Clostridiales bacterium]|jgi:probable rRNA maturation factor|nr:rRNA maturation RNase YbeY [Clostridiales bacterium]